MTNLLIVEDDIKIAALLEKFLTGEGFAVTSVADGETAIDTINASQPDVVLLDLMLPGKDGMDVCKAVRPNYHGIIIMMTASDDEFNELMALNSGVDDYVTKPIRLPILLARIQAVSRRSQSPQVTTRTIQDLQLDRTSRQAIQAEKPLDLTDAEFELLWVLAEQQGKIVSRDQLFEQLLGRDYDGLDRSIDMRVSKLRKKLGDLDSPPKYIRTLRGRGYILL